MGVPLNIVNWLMAAAPIILLLSGILILKFSNYKIGAIIWMVTVVLAMTVFGADVKTILLASSKGLSLALYVLLIIWGAVFLYNIADKAGAITVIGKTMSKVSDDKLTQCLLLAWCFTSLLQGLAGFGVPVAVVAPILVIMGFSPMVAVTACLVGHSWSISFGSMGSSYNTIQLVTGIPGEVIGPQMALLFIIPIFLTGFAVAHMYGGVKAVVKSAPLVLITGTCMSAGLYVMNVIGMTQLAGLGAAACGCTSTIIYARAAGPKNRAKQDVPEETGSMSFVTSCSPYFSLILISIAAQLPFVKSALSGFAWGFDYPAMVTGFGYATEAVSKYSKISWFSHPAPILLVSACIGSFVYITKAGAKKSILLAAFEQTVKKCVSTSVGIATMVMMALIMTDTGMTKLIAEGLALVFGSFYPIISPFIGILGTFLTGSNTNSNSMFGALQYETALTIGKSGVIMAALQSVGGSLGVSVAPSSIMMGAANVDLTGSESKIMSQTLRYCLFTTAILGVVVWFLTRV